MRKPSTKGSCHVAAQNTALASSRTKMVFSHHWAFNENLFLAQLKDSGCN